MRVDATLLYFMYFTEYATDAEGLNLQQSQCDPCLFYQKNEDGNTLGAIIMVWHPFIDEMN